MVAEITNTPETAEKMVERMYSAAQPGVVYSEPVVAGSFTVVTASEVAAGGGFGFLQGHGPADTASESSEAPGGGGGGGGGGSMGRPVAVITIGPEGVAVKPVLDVTKIALAGVTAWGAVAATAIRLSRGRRGR
jgi:uncharacterized spore protein YtfJ